MASNDRPVFFISSSMSELAEERGVVRKAVAKFADGTYETFCFEEDAVAQGGSPQAVWREQLERTDTTIGLLYQKMGQYTEEELRISRERGIPVLLFRKKDKEQVLEREAGEFIAWLEDAEVGITAKYFKTPKQLKHHVKEALARQQKELFAVARGARRSGTISVDGTELVEEAPPKVGRRSAPPKRLPRQRLLVGRTDETTRLLTAIDRARDTDRRHIVLIGPDGVGKRALLCHLTHSGDLEEFPDGTAVYPDWKEREDAEDLRQALWEEFYDTQNTVDPRGRDRQLREIEALVFLPGVDGGADIDDVVEDTMPRSVFCTSRRELASPVVPVKVAGLTEDADMLAVFEHQYGDVPDDAHDAVVALCRGTGGNPGAIELLATQALLDAPGDDDPAAGQRLAAWASEATLDAGIAPEETRVLRVVSEVGDAHTPRGVLADVVGSDEPVDRALGRGHLRSASPRYRLNPVLDRDAGDELMPEVVASTLRWLEDAPHAEIFANRTFVLRMLSWGVEQQRWDDVIALGRGAEASFAMGGRHGAWQELLEHVATAARQVDPADEATLGWALHQLGTRSLLRDQLDEGRDYLFESFRLRRDDEDARELTHRNLKLLPAAVLPWYVLVAVPIVLVLILLALFLSDDRRPDLDVDFGRTVFPVATVEATGEIQEPANVEDAELVSVSIEDVTIDGIGVTAGDAGFCIAIDGECVDDASSAAGGLSVTEGQLCDVVEADPTRRAVGHDGCVIEIGFTPTTFGSFSALLRLVADDGSEFEGRIEAISDAAIVEVDPDFQQLEVGQLQSFSVTNVATVAIDVGEVVVQPIRPDAPDSEDVGGTPGGLDVEVRCPSRLEQNDDCTIDVRAQQSGAYFLELEFLAADGTVPQVLGDARVLVVVP